MKKYKDIHISFSELEYIELQKIAKNHKMTVTTYIKGLVLENFKIYYNKLLENIDNIPLNQKFTIQDLLKDDWDDLNKGLKLSLGRAFRKSVQNKLINNVEYKITKFSRDPKYIRIS